MPSSNKQRLRRSAIAPAVYNTDVYAFASPDKPDTVTLIANWLQEPNGGPNFYP
jgi:hypothetical protein